MERRRHLPASAASSSPGVVPVFTGEDLSRLERAYAGRSFQQRRDAAVIAVFRATRIRLRSWRRSRYDHHDPQHSDIDLQLREITVHGKGQKTRIVRISFGAARSAGRYYAPAPGTPRHTGPSCGSRSATAAR